MTSFYNSLQRGHLGYAAIFICIAIGFLFLGKIDKSDVGPGYWTVSFFLNGLGFVFWSGLIPLSPRQYFLLGEVFHVAGFWLLAIGAHRFTGETSKKWFIIAFPVWVIVWILSILLHAQARDMAAFSLKALRAVIFISTGILILPAGHAENTPGKKLAGLSLITWGVYILAFSFITMDGYLYFGFLVGFHVLAAFGMVAMIVDKMRIRAEKSEERVERLEGILPICSYCKKIRDERNEWHYLEEYIEDRSKAEFSHGICPDCFQRYRPDKT